MLTFNSIFMPVPENGFINELRHVACRGKYCLKTELCLGTKLCKFCVLQVAYNPKPSYD